jgi:hypothetical protein
MRALKRERGSLAPPLARDDAIVFGDAEGNHRQSVPTSRPQVGNDHAERLHPRDAR